MDSQNLTPPSSNSPAGSFPSVNSDDFPATSSSNLTVLSQSSSPLPISDDPSLSSLPSNLQSTVSISDNNPSSTNSSAFPPKPNLNSNSSSSPKPAIPSLDDLFASPTAQPKSSPALDDLFASPPKSKSASSLDDLFPPPQAKSAKTPELDLSGLEEKVDDLATPTQKADDAKIEAVWEAKQEEENITQFNDQLDQQNPVLVSSRNKEHLSSSAETVSYQELSTEFEPSAETQEVKASPSEDKIDLPEPVKDDFGDIILEASRVPLPNITLPITQDEMDEGLKFYQKVSNSFAWLAAWCKRHILLAPKRVFFPKKDK